MAPPTTGSHRGRPARIGLRLRATIGILVVLVVLVGLNAFVLDRETGKAHLNVAGAELVDTTSGPLQVLDTGPPPGRPEASALVLIHGTGGAINWWDALIPELRDSRRVIALDLLGYGGSAKPDSGYSIESQAGLVAQVLARLGVSRAIAVGHSLGGSVATALAADSPDLVSGLVLIDSAPDRVAGDSGLAARASLWPVIGPLLWRLAPDAILRNALSRAFAPGADIPGRFVADIREMTFPAYRDSARAGDEYVGTRSLPDRIQSAGTPLMVIFGADDRIYPARESLSAYVSVPGAETMLVRGSGHSPQVEKPGQTAAGILEFADRVDRATEAREHQVRQRRKRLEAAARRSRTKPGKQRAAADQNAGRRAGPGQTGRGRKKAGPASGTGQP